MNARFEIRSVWSTKAGKSKDFPVFFVYLFQVHLGPLVHLGTCYKAMPGAKQAAVAPDIG